MKNPFVNISVTMHGVKVILAYLSSCFEG